MIVGEECWRRCCREVLARSAATRCCREVSEKSVGDKGCREVLVIAAQTKNADKCTVTDFGAIFLIAHHDDETAAPLGFLLTDGTFLP